MDCNSSRCEYSIYHKKGCRDPNCIRVRTASPVSFRPFQMRAPPALLRGWGSKTYTHSLFFLSPFEIHSITALKYKKSLTPSTMTALHVAQQQRAHLHVDISINCCLLALFSHFRSCFCKQREPCPRTSTIIPPFIIEPYFITNDGISPQPPGATPLPAAHPGSFPVTSSHSYYTQTLEHASRSMCI